MEISGWENRYRSGERASEDLQTAPTALVVETARILKPGKALDLACGTGRNAIWLAQHGWSVTAVDGAPTAIEILRHRASEANLRIESVAADLEKGEYSIAPSNFDLVTICYYLQLNLFETAKQGVKPGGILLSIVHILEPGEPPQPHRLAPCKLQDFFQGWRILHLYEGKPNDSAHHHAVAEIVAQRPVGICQSDHRK
jgi:tellurite methyltransferase